MNPGVVRVCYACQTEIKGALCPVSARHPTILAERASIIRDARGLVVDCTAAPYGTRDPAGVDGRG